MKVLRQILEIVYTLAVRIPHPPEFILVQVCLDSVECVSLRLVATRST